jgi:hypothetical protein
MISGSANGDYAPKGWFGPHPYEPPSASIPWSYTAGRRGARRLVQDGGAPKTSGRTPM